MRVSRGADEGTAGFFAGLVTGGAGGAILMPGETTTLTELRDAAGDRSKAKAAHRMKK